jgi:hypothetical protein
MAEQGEWNRKGTVLSDVIAQKEYGITRDFIVEGIRSGKLEFREGAVWGNPYLRVLRSQFEPYIAAKLGSEHLATRKAQTELRTIKRKASDLTTKLASLKCERLNLSVRSRHSGTSDDVHSSKLPLAIGCDDNVRLIAGIMVRGSYADHRTGIDCRSIRLRGTADSRFPPDDSADKRRRDHNCSPIQLRV